jgi:hypothetical protein
VKSVKKNEEQYEVLAANITFLGMVFPKGTIIKRDEWQFQTDEYNAKRAENTPKLDLDDTFAHLLEKKIIVVVEEEKEEEETPSAPPKKKWPRKEK